MLEDEFLFMLGDDSTATCLDIGCGAGWQAVYLDKVGIGDRITYHGIDVSTHMCDRAKINYPKGTYEVRDVFELDEDKKYDIVAACGVIEHFEDWQDFVEKCCKLSEEWVLFHKIFVQNGPTKCIVRTAYDKQDEFRVYINRTDLENEFKKHGFTVKKEYNWDGHTYSTIARRV
jgi:cyclopropane fatty-acyl-phospholipid synthase-like methyltransferase